MAKKPKPYYQFGELLTEGIKRSAKNRSVVQTQEDLAYRLGVSFNTIYTWRRGEHLPEPELVAEIARYFVESWGPDATWTKKFLNKGEYGTAETIASLMVDLYGQASTPPPTTQIIPIVNPTKLQGLSLDIFKFLTTADPGPLKNLHAYKQLVIQNHWSFPDPFVLCRGLLTTALKHLQQRYPHLAQPLIETYFQDQELSPASPKTNLPPSRQKADLHLAFEQLARVISEMESTVCFRYKLNIQLRIPHQTNSSLFGI
jgi:transcriptional regulator with XRE-family HTH domain